MNWWKGWPRRNPDSATEFRPVSDFNLIFAFNFDDVLGRSLKAVE